MRCHDKALTLSLSLARTLTDIKHLPHTLQLSPHTCPIWQVDTYFESIRAKYETQADSYYASARLWDDGLIEPAQTRTVLSLALSISANAPVPKTNHGIFRM